MHTTDVSMTATSDMPIHGFVYDSVYGGGGIMGLVESTRTCERVRSPPGVINDRFSASFPSVPSTSSLAKCTWRHGIPAVIGDTDISLQRPDVSDIAYSRPLDGDFSKHETWTRASKNKCSSALQLRGGSVSIYFTPLTLRQRYITSSMKPFFVLRVNFGDETYTWHSPLCPSLAVPRERS